MKKLICSLICIISFASAFAQFSFDAGLGSGFIFYGDKTVRNRISSFDNSAQVILNAEAGVSFPLVSSTVYLQAGVDSILDARWKGSEHIFLVDYCAAAGFRVYPGVAGLYADVDYCLGRRTDYYSLDADDEEILNTKWGNGFDFGIGYDFGYGSRGFGPQVKVSWRHMPRGNSSDNILELKLKLDVK